MVVDGLPGFAGLATLYRIDPPIKGADHLIVYHRPRVAGQPGQMTVALGTEDGVSLSADIRPQPGRTSPMSRITISPSSLRVDIGSSKADIPRSCDVTATWRKQEPDVIPLTLWAGEDFVRELVFDGLVGGIPADSTITLKLFDGTGPDAAEIGSWPASIVGTDVKWSVDHAVADAIPTPGGYRLMMTVPNPGTPSNPTVERCLALGKLVRK
ncbi:hypothetical protein GS441_21025 [Rhodococcus hoagii]|uniref:LtfC/p132/Gp6 beta-sandwich domain-containing protein n=1 Tax=Rhodococcus hoagii TaxID=43767 RepID=A0A9Q2PQ62_RHOHA|nr:hypothetical protein [Prescottella equi]